ncbi:SusC/RagA family TonB-linked outer membrane protein [Parapedobacter pyrenivorans]|uniref:SusC/RagA family TonB-linked outer membrane protein n=1 Tax=Parapedobacter pyrenivorans TaxID=1305674 RepID=A0A917HUS5_9SPHI|nr:SusC/RagA family TonB-linked outer membrane protein [Parapedobacter pyrenivorans]GGG91661.1 SusC/RagA family TonB-linked outer membrane protein [Parapedobacter pyrenivorans]
MKQKLLCFFMLGILLIGSAYAQDRRISGRVTAAADGSPISGVSVFAVGTNVAAQTDEQGAFTINAPQAVMALEFRFLGYTTQRVDIGNQSVINVQLTEDAASLDEVVVTALGISRDAKSLGYSATKVDSEDITRTSPVSMFDGLQGKIAGANITSQSGAPGASTKVVLRGYSSISGNNQPLYVIDGVPVNNSTFGEAEPVNRSTDFGNNANDINPADIESINVLKGAGATSLYGSRAANGVIVITTKKGKAGKISVDLNHSTTLSSILMLPRLQNTFGQGWSGIFDPIEQGSWGPRFDGANRLWGNTVDNARLVKPFVALENNIRDFYDTGAELNTNIAVSGGNEQSTFYLSYGNISSDGIVPTDADSYNRNTLSLRGSTKYEKFNASGSINYVGRKAKFIATGQGTNTGATMFQELIQFPRDISIVDGKDYEAKFYDINTFYTPYAQNPYFVLNENGNDFNSDRVYGNAEVGYEFANWLSSTVRVGGDFTNSRLKDWQAINRPDGNSPNASRQPDVGGVMEEARYFGEFNTDVLLNFNAPINEDFTFDGLLGWNYNQRETRVQTSAITNLTVPEFYNLSNSSAPPTSSADYTKRRLFGAYAQANFGFRDYLFLSLNARNDWSSTLPMGKNSFFYPAANLSLVLTDLAPSLKDNGISFAKLRASLGQTGNDAGVYLLSSLLTGGDVLLGFGNITFPLGGVGSFEVANQIGNSALEPEITTEYELGADVRFLNNRVGFDFSYYNKRTDGQILPVPIAHTSGYGFLVMNFGLVENKGIELAVNVTPVKSDVFSWDLNYVFARNRNKVLELPEGLNEVVIASGYDIDFVAIKGQPLGVYKGPVEERDPNGNVVVNPSNGIPTQADDKEVFGNSQRDFTMGLTNTLRLNNWSLGFAFDYRKGGKFWSYTSQLTDFIGNSVRTTYNDRNPYIFPNSVNKITDSEGNVSYVENTTPIDVENYYSLFNNGSTTQTESRRTVLDKTSLRLRDVTLSYAFSQTVASRIGLQGLSLTAFGRNLLLWVPAENGFIDPDVSTYNNDLRGDLGEFAGGPTTRSYGLSLRATF